MANVLEEEKGKKKREEEKGTQTFFLTSISIVNQFLLSC